MFLSCLGVKGCDGGGVEFRKDNGKKCLCAIYYERFCLRVLPNLAIKYMAASATT